MDAVSNAENQVKIKAKALEVIKHFFTNPQTTKNKQKIDFQEGPFRRPALGPMEFLDGLS